MSTNEREPTIYEDFYNFFKLRDEIKKEEEPLDTAKFINASEKYSRLLKIEGRLKVKLERLGTEGIFDVMEETYNDYRELEQESKLKGEELEKIRIKYGSLLDILHRTNEVKKEYPQKEEMLQTLQEELEKHLKRE